MKVSNIEIIVTYDDGSGSKANLDIPDDNWPNSLRVGFWYIKDIIINKLAGGNIGE